MVDRPFRREIEYYYRKKLEVYTRAGAMLQKLDLEQQELDPQMAYYSDP